MLYLGHFSFDENNEEGRFGHFSCMVDEKNPEGAEKAFKKLILDMRKKKTLFDTVPVDIYLDTFIEIGGIPKTGVVTCYSSYNKEFSPGHISTYLPHEDRGECKPYFYYPEDRPDIAEKIDAMESFEAVPFVTFEPTVAQKKAALLKEQMDKLSRPEISEKRKPFSQKHHW